jgi:hypothetical protein
VIVVLLAVGITIVLARRSQTARRWLAGQLVDPNLDQFNRSTFFTGDPTGVSPWTRASVLVRIAVRYGCVAVLLLTIIGLFTQRTLTVAALLTAATLIAAWWGWNIWRWATTRGLRRDVINPLFDGLRATVGWDDGIKPRDVILAGNDYHKTGVTLLPPSEYQRLDPVLEHTAIIASRTLGGEWEPDFDLIGEPTIRLQHAPPPPDSVTWDQLELHLLAVESSKLLLGLGSRGRPVVIDLDNETPHIMLSVPSGGGKTVAAELLGCQILHQGGQLIVIDLDRATDWVKDGDHLLPGVTYARTVEEATATLAHLAQIFDQRNLAADADPNYSPHRILLQVEEPNRTAGALDRTALTTLRALSFGGRKRRIHVMVTPQRGVASIFGTVDGGAARENFKYRVLGGDSDQDTWDLLAKQVTHRPEPTKHRGRMFVIDGNTYKTVQVGYLTDEQARAWATSGGPSPTPPPTTQPFIGIA